MNRYVSFSVRTPLLGIDGRTAGAPAVFKIGPKLLKKKKRYENNSVGMSHFIDVAALIIEKQQRNVIKKWKISDLTKQNCPLIDRYKIKPGTVETIIHSALRHTCI